MSSSQMTSLESLYPDALLIVTEYLSPTWIVNLWLTGSTQLRTSLAKRGVITSLSLKGPQGYFSTSRLPGMVSSFESLLHLTIYSPYARIAHPYRIWNCLSKLSQLKTLDLEFPQVDEWLFLIGGIDPNFPSLFLEESDHNSSSEPPTTCVRPLATTFPNLETLALSDTSTETQLQNEHLKLFPPSLTSLKLNFRKGGGVNAKCLEYISSLPKLAQLWFVDDFCDRLSIPLPPSITSLSIVCRGSISIEPSFWVGSNMMELLLPIDDASVAHLPPSITKLKMFALGNLTTPLSFAHLPSLLSADISSPTQLEMPIFNSALETLNLHFSLREGSVQPGAAISSVEKLYIQWDNCLDLPSAFISLGSLSKLVKLKIGTDHGVDASCFEYLPTSLTSFQWNNTNMENVIIDTFIDKLPRGLKSLEFPYYSATISTRFFCHLPRSLETLSICLAFSGDFSDEELAKHASELPRALRDFRVIPYVPIPLSTT